MASKLAPPTAIGAPHKPYRVVSVNTGAVRARMAQQGVTGAQAAKHFGISQPHFHRLLTNDSRWETGRWEEFCRLLGLPPRVLLLEWAKPCGCGEQCDGWVKEKAA